MRVVETIDFNAIGGFFFLCKQNCFLTHVSKRNNNHRNTTSYSHACRVPGHAKRWRARGWVRADQALLIGCSNVYPSYTQIRQEM